MFFLCSFLSLRGQTVIQSEIFNTNTSGTNVRFAFRRYGLATASREWQIGDIEIAAGGVTCVAPVTQATTPSVSPSTTTATINWAKGDHLHYCRCNRQFHDHYRHYYPRWRTRWLL